MSKSKTWRIVGINFDHMHMGDLLRMTAQHPQAEIVGISDENPDRMAEAARKLDIPADRVFTQYDRCLETARPDLAILCPATAAHADWVEKVAAFDVPILLEKPFAASLKEADRIISAMARSGRTLAINWPLRWYPSHATAKRILEEGRIGKVVEVHYYGGNRGPLYHGADKIEREPDVHEKDASWFYRKSKGGGSLLDYLGYGTTLGTWYHQGQKPDDVTCVTGGTPGLEVDEHSVTIARYPQGISKFETRWGTFTDPWTHQPQPKCGFVIRGTDGTLGSHDLESTIRLQTREHPEGLELPVDEPSAPHRNPIEYFIHCLETGQPVGGPLDPAISRIGQQIVDTAVASAAAQKTMPLIA